tara:strand:- start:1430 stop:1651 length:222 start_codon:yes stop_codon:yes gene_type:complete
MFYKLKRVTISILINGFLLIGLIVSIQNSNNKSSVNLFGFETIQLPISFITGVSFISGTFLGGLLPIFISRKN